MTMLSLSKIRTQVIKYSSLSHHQPDYYFILGYFMGLATCPVLIPFSRWIGDLFGTVNFDEHLEIDYMNAVLQLYNIQMEKVMLQDLQLPAKCVLSKKNIEASLAKGQPLPQWCSGMLKGLKFINNRTLNNNQRKELNYLKELLLGYTSVTYAKQAFSIMSGDYQYIAHESKRMLSTYICNTIYLMRFADEKMSEYDLSDDLDDGEYGEFEDFGQDAFEDFMFNVMTQSSPCIRTALNEVIGHIEEDMGEDFIRENTGIFWGLHQTRTYMTLRSRRARLNFSEGKLAEAIEELKDLLVLNPNDNQANRYPLFSYLILAKRWQELDKLLLPIVEPSLFVFSAKVLSCYAQYGDCKESKALKKQLKKANKYFERYITGRNQAPEEPPEFYQPGEKSEVFVYLNMAGKETWRSVEGSLFWLRKNK
ncbi:MAG: UPF0149 family protein [Alteromonadaceae bacterium]|nr:UPF0149 family protein [Alteromonadaceae bacterium]